MRKLLCSLIIVTMLSGCAKYVQVPNPPDISNQLKVIADSNITPDQKVITMKDLISVSEREYQTLLARMESKGGNVKEIVLAIIMTLSAIATPLVIAYTK